jgi:hypothetical protein
MNHIKLLTPAEMNIMIAEQEADLSELETTLEQKLGNGAAAAQAKRLVATALVKQAAAMLQQASGSVQYLDAEAATSNEEAPQEAGDNTPLGVVVKMAEEVSENLAEMLGVEAAAIPPFLVECNSIMLVLSGDMINRAKEKLTEAAAAESLASNVK